MQVIIKERPQVWFGVFKSLPEEKEVWCETKSLLVVYGVCVKVILIKRPSFSNTYILQYFPGTESLLVLSKFHLKGQSCKLYNNKYMIASTQITNTEVFAFIVVLFSKLLNDKVLFINKKNNKSS